MKFGVASGERHHTNCEDWGYDTHPLRPTSLARRSKRLTQKIQNDVSSFDRFGFDTRRAHLFLFFGLTPSNCKCILGQYRGEKSCKYLEALHVGIHGDPSVGLAPHLIANAMVDFEKRCQALTNAHNYWLNNKGATQPPKNALLRFVSVLADVLQQFLTIHPYMDGNGHSARLLTFTMMARAGYQPTHWDIDAKQPYAEALSSHRAGKPGALQQFMLRAIIGPV